MTIFFLNKTMELMNQVLVVAIVMVETLLNADEKYMRIKKALGIG